MTSTAAKSSKPDRAKDTSKTSPSGIWTSESLTDESLQGIQEWLMSCQPDSPANPSPSPASRLVTKMNATYGESRLKSLASINRHLCLSRTYPESCRRLWGYEESEQTWSDWVTKWRRACLKLGTLARAIGESGSLSWPTPDQFLDSVYANQKSQRKNLNGCNTTAAAAVRFWQTPIPPESPKTRRQPGQDVREALLPAQAEMWPTPNVPDRGAETKESKSSRPGAEGIDLQTTADNWPSPRGEGSECCGNHPGAVDSLTGATKLWPTPTAGEVEGGKHPRANNPYDRSLTDEACRSSLPAPPTSTSGGKSSKSRRRLNPLFVAWLMGYLPQWFTRPCPADVGKCSCTSPGSVGFCLP